MHLVRKLLAVALTAVVALCVSLPATAQSTSQTLGSESVIETIKKRGVIKIGLSLFVPWSMRDLNGDLIGYELDVGRKLAKDMGVEVEFIPTSWDGIIPALVSGTFDVIISGMTVTPQRNLTVNFTQPYAFSGLTILANTAMTGGYSLDDYNSEDVTFAARRGATPAVYIANKFPKATLLLFDEDGAATQEVLNGNAHATMATEPGPSNDARRNPETLNVPFDVAFDAGGEGFALRKSDPDGLAYFNSWIARHHHTGWLKTTHDYWFRGHAWADLVEQK
jgi:polar amino acid transport system substrate-binding protein|tara:strand:- start:2396 stop:3232 length:837 start_codon:yes stop_codon:yes gene_type:complete